jgi:hypothetical protein
MFESPFISWVFLLPIFSLPVAVVRRDTTNDGVRILCVGQGVDSTLAIDRSLDAIF